MIVEFGLRLWKLLKLPKKTQLAIMRMFQTSFLVGVTGVILNEKNQVLLFHHSYRQNKWSLPGGYLKIGEGPREGLVREVKEEANLEIVVTKRLNIYTDPETARMDIPYVAKVKKGKFRKSAEVIKIKYFDVDKLPELPKRQKYLIKESVKLISQ
jgi:ADP-ribose pyrophosphatase YjhB (NUDIX family)